MNKIIHFKIKPFKIARRTQAITMLIVGMFLILPTLSATQYTITNSSVAQQIKDKNVSLNVKERFLRDILIEIKKQTGIGFAFNERVNLKELQNMSIQVRNQSIASVLNNLLAKTNY